MVYLQMAEKKRSPQPTDMGNLSEPAEAVWDQVS